MINIETLKSPSFKNKKAFRKGRGHGSGNGKTSGRGHKGQKARSGGGVRLGFEGGQMPLIRRIPKRGFTNNFNIKYDIINVEELNKFDDNTIVTIDLLIKCHLHKNVKNKIKILGDGVLSKKLTVKVNAFSKSAVDKIKAAGGVVEVI